MQQKVPQKLFICMLKTRFGEKSYESIHEAAQEEHTRYMSDLWQRGIFWAGGPGPGRTIAIEIYSVETVEEAMKAQRNAPHYRSGYIYEDQYLEWTPRHWPPLRPNIEPASGKPLDRQK
jgi:uncharacterized protein YciI